MASLRTERSERVCARRYQDLSLQPRCVSYFRRSVNDENQPQPHPLCGCDYRLVRKHASGFCTNLRLLGLARIGGGELRGHADKDAYICVTSRVSIDADGAPNAYHPDNPGLNHYGNASWPDQSWWPDVLVPDPAKPAKP